MRQPCKSVLVLPQTHGRDYHRSIQHLYIELPVRFQNPDPADVPRIAADQEGIKAVAAADPRFQNARKIVNVVDDESRPSQGAPHNRKEVNQERRRVRRHRRQFGDCNSFGPSAGRRLSQSAVNGAVISGHGEGQPFLQLAKGQHRHPVRVVPAAFGRIGERGPGKFVDLLHCDADNPFHDPAIVWPARRPIAQADTVLLASSA